MNSKVENDDKDASLYDISLTINPIENEGHLSSSMNFENQENNDNFEGIIIHKLYLIKYFLII